MPIAKILDEIDGYLSILHQAREILSGGRTETPQIGALRKKQKSILERTRPAVVSRRVEEKNSQSNHVAHPLSAVTNRAASRIQSFSDVILDAPRPKQQTPVAPEHTIPQSIEIKRIPARHRTGSIRSLRQQAAKPASDRKPHAIKPAIALAGPAKTKIIVVSAEQLQRQREQAAQSAVLGSRRPASVLSGRSAFEALFSGGREPAKTSGQ
jgi:hypothetical protein